MSIRFVYVAYPIDQDAGGRFYAQVEFAKSELLRTGTDVVFDPGDAFTVRQGSAPGPEIQRINRLAHNVMAGGVVAFLPSGVATVGVPMEIVQAAASGKWVAIVTDLKSKSWALADLPGLRESPRRPATTVLFDLTNEGILGAVHWMNSHDVEPYEPQDHYLPVKVEAKGECGLSDPHEPHVFGEDMVDHCQGMINLLPYRAHADDAGFDLVCAETVIIDPGTMHDVDLGIAIELEPYQFGRITGRSSTIRKHGLLVNEGIIDAGYRGRLFAAAWNLTQKPVKVERGSRIAQLLIHSRSTRMYIQPVAELSESDRGDKGFGSSGS